MQGGTWNLDATCGSTPIALQTACALVQAGMYRNILVVVSCTYSRFVDEDNTLAWFFSDGAGAFVVSPLELNQGILGTKALNTSVLCDHVSSKIIHDHQGDPHSVCKYPNISTKLWVKRLRGCYARVVKVLLRLRVSP